MVDELNADDGIDGILVQLPLPAGLDPRPSSTESIPPKMWMGFIPITWVTSRRVVHGLSRTPYGVMRLLEQSDVPRG